MRIKIRRWEPGTAREEGWPAACRGEARAAAPRRLAVASGPASHSTAWEGQVPLRGYHPSRGGTRAQGTPCITATRVQAVLQGCGRLAQPRWGFPKAVSWKKALKLGSIGEPPRSCWERRQGAKSLMNLIGCELVALEVFCSEVGATHHTAARGALHKSSHHVPGPPREALWGPKGLHGEE